jgi:hypothetical protein
MPQGGMLVTNNDIGDVNLFDTVFDDAVYVPTAADALDLAGTILGRITASGKLAPYTAAFTYGAGTEVPIGVLHTDVQATSGPADENIRFIVSGRVREDELRIDSGAKGTGITEPIKDLLRDFGIVPLSAVELSKLDNQ